MCNTIEKNYGYGCGICCESFKSESGNIYSPKHHETVFVIECQKHGKMIFSAETGRRLE